jgi:hypothetical protein
MSKSVIYYNDHHIGEPIVPLCQKYIEKSGLPIVSCSLNKPTDFGENYVIEGKRGWATMARQIVVALEHSTADYVFFTEHDVLYSPSHWVFDPPRDDTFYYNAHNFRWLFGADHAISYNRMISLSGLCCNRLLALNHFKARLEEAQEKGYLEDYSREPAWARKWGYEPGTKSTKKGGFSDEPFDVWYSENPNIDIRHNHTLSVPKTTLEEFRHKPEGWVEIPIEAIPKWDLKKLFQL